MLFAYKKLLKKAEERTSYTAAAEVYSLQNDLV
jgi:hypothetical protein